jgi:DNA mismatch endonuclease (patch repair protein)
MARPSTRPSPPHKRPASSRHGSYARLCARRTQRVVAARSRNAPLLSATVCPSEPRSRAGVPPASSAQVRRRMKATRQRDTPAELALRSELHQRGLRFRVDRGVLKGLRRRADIVFPRQQIAVFVDGCFWHGCPVHGTWPRNNADWWRSKIEANRTRDADTDLRLLEAGWLSIRVWEHEIPAVAATRIAPLVRERQPTPLAVSRPSSRRRNEPTRSSKGASTSLSAS